MARTKKTARQSDAEYIYKELLSRLPEREAALYRNLRCTRCPIMELFVSIWHGVLLTHFCWSQSMVRLPVCVCVCLSFLSFFEGMTIPPGKKVDRPSTSSEGTELLFHTRGGKPVWIHERFIDQNDPKFQEALQDGQIPFFVEGVQSLDGDDLTVLMNRQCNKLHTRTHLFADAKEKVQ